MTRKKFGSILKNNVFLRRLYQFAKQRPEVGWVVVRVRPVVLVEEETALVDGREVAAVVVVEVVVLL